MFKVLSLLEQKVFGQSWVPKLIYKYKCIYVGDRLRDSVSDWVRGWLSEWVSKWEREYLCLVPTDRDGTLSLFLKTKSEM